jgi:4-amino-4-deoxy-L-arabinose transferase-like glycosyltransferase
MPPSFRDSGRDTGLENRLVPFPNVRFPRTCGHQYGTDAEMLETNSPDQAPERREFFGTACPSISLVLPAYNEQEVIVQAIREADQGLAEFCDDYEVIVVDDGSSDETYRIALEEAQSLPAVRVISLETNQGYGAALRTGFQAATKAFVGFTDADCQFDVRQLDRLALLLRDCDVACGYRIDRQDHWLRLLYSRVYNVMVRVMLGTGVRDVDCAFKLFRHEALESILHETSGFIVNAELLTKARERQLSVVEVGVTHRPRADGESTVSVLHSIPVLKSLVRFWWSKTLFPAETATTSQALPQWPASRRSAAIVVLSLLSLVMFLGNLSYPLIEPDESRYAQIALEMVQSGDYLVPRLSGEPYLDKPPLLYWATAAGFQLLGPSEAAARLPSAFAAWLTVLVTFVLGRRLVGDRAAFLGSLSLFLCLGYVLAARFLIMDGLLTLFTTASILAALLATGDSRVRLGWWLVAAASCGLGILTKGPVAAVLTLPPLILAQWLVPERPRLTARHWILYAGTILLMTGPWFVLIGQHQGQFVTHFFWKHHIVRFVSAFNHQEPFWYYAPVLLIGMFPASLLTAPTLVFLTSRAERFRQCRTPQVGSILLAGVWIIVFFSISKCKLPTYILPALPFLGMVLGAMLSMILQGNRALLPLPRIMGQLPRHATVSALLIGGVIATIDLLLEADHGLPRMMNIAMIITAGIAVAYSVRNRRGAPAERGDWVFAITVSLMVMAFGFQKFMPELAHYRSVNANAAQLQIKAGDAPLPVVYFDYPLDGTAFHLSPEAVRRYTADELDSLRQYLLVHRRAVVVVDRDHIAELSSHLEDIVTLTPTRGARGRVFLSEPPPATRLGAKPLETSRR